MSQNEIFLMGKRNKSFVENLASVLKQNPVIASLGNTEELCFETVHEQLTYFFEQAPEFRLSENIIYLKATVNDSITIIDIAKLSLDDQIWHLSKFVLGYLLILPENWKKAVHSFGMETLILAACYHVSVGSPTLITADEKNTHLKLLTFAYIETHPSRFATALSEVKMFLETDVTNGMLEWLRVLVKQYYPQGVLSDCTMQLHLMSMEQSSTIN